MNKQLNIDIPFRCHFSLKPLLDFWKTYTVSLASSPMKQLADSIAKSIEQLPELGQIQNDKTLIQKHPELMEAIMSAVFPSSIWETEVCAAGKPFSMEFFFSNSLYREMSGSGVSIGAEKQFESKALHAYASILNRFYGFDIDYKRPLIFEVAVPDTTFKKYYQINIDLRFVNIVPVGDLPELSEKEKALLTSNLDNLTVLGKHIPASSFEFHGMTVLRSVDITEQVILSDIKNSLLQANVITNPDKFLTLQNKVINLFRIPDIGMWLAAMRDDEVLMLNAGHHGQSGCIYEISQHFKIEAIKGTVFEKVLCNRECVCINELEDLKGQNPLYDEMIAHGQRSILVAPLVENDVVIGVFGLSTIYSGVFNALNSHKLDEILPLFALAVKRSLEEFASRVEIMIQENFTSIHPSVAWRFRKAVVNYLKKMAGDVVPEMEEIVFNNIFPLYCVSDIRGSSDMRNHAIQEDLTEHLVMAKEILEQAYAQEQLPVFDELIYRIDKSREAINSGLSSGDEIKVINFIRNDIETCFSDLDSHDDRLQTQLTHYRSEVEKNMGTVYHKRKAYDDSVAMINQTISQYLDEVQPRAQAMFPHYFDRQVTDGVDQSIYVGDALTADREFSTFHLKNLRLWQFIILCELAVKLDQLKLKMPVTLDTTHLIVVQDMPISIRFDADENRFRVDGAYNIRYEIMKKRIDKAVVKQTGERLTQPRKIAIVYSHSTEALEYFEYVDYLTSKGYLKEGVEELDLQDLQGIKGLKALRVTVDLPEGN